MKKYSFPLSNVLNFREQVLENLKSEHAQILMQVTDQEKQVGELKAKLQSTGDWMKEEMKEHPVSIGEVQECRQYMGRLRQQILAAEKELARLREEEEAKRAEVVAAKKEKASIERLKEKSHEEYQLAYRKDEEKQIEEFVTNKRLMHAEN